MCITTASLQIITKPGGLFSDMLSISKIIIGTEPAVVAVLGRFPLAEHIYIGDVNQSEPRVHCPQSSRAARRAPKISWSCAEETPLVQVVTPYRAHPALNALPDSLVYDGTSLAPLQHDGDRCSRVTSSSET
uniref:AAA_12 domain-containing protein n=1 Tax=Haemonchus placei TaxID=6290 RepID=A0A0N4X155_HAEPC